jgi:hypothetical protein
MLFHLIDQVRKKIDDRTEPYVFSNEDVLLALNNAQNEFVQRTLCLQDCSQFVEIKKGEPMVELPKNVLRLRFIEISNAPPISPVTTVGIVGISSWQNVYGVPVYAITDLDTNRVRLTPIPNRDFTGIVHAYIYPEPMKFQQVEDREDDNEVFVLEPEVGPQIPEIYVNSLITGAILWLFKTQDADIFDPRQVQAWEADWMNKLRQATADVSRAQRGVVTAKFNRNGVW